jgi:hypothetical protein
MAVGAGPHGDQAGMTLRERWSDWTRAPFTSESTSHVSVWEKMAERSNRDREQQVSILPPAGPALKW